MPNYDGCAGGCSGQRQTCWPHRPIKINSTRRWFSHDQYRPMRRRALNVGVRIFSTLNININNDSSNNNNILPGHNLNDGELLLSFGTLNAPGTPSCVFRQRLEPGGLSGCFHVAHLFRFARDTTESAAEDGTNMQPVRLLRRGEQVVCCWRESLATIWRGVSIWPSTGRAQITAGAQWPLTTRRRLVDVFIITTGTIRQRPPRSEKRKLPLKWRRSYLLPVALMSVRKPLEGYAAKGGRRRRRRRKRRRRRRRSREEKSAGCWTGLAAFISLREWPHCWLHGLAAGGVGNC